MLCNGMRSSSLWKQGAEHGVFETQKFVRSRCVAFFPAGGGGGGGGHEKRPKLACHIVNEDECVRWLSMGNKRIQP